MTTDKMGDALALLQRARDSDPSTWDGVCYGDATFYDREIHVAYVNVQTANALVRRGLIEFGERDPEWGTEVRLVRAAAAPVSTEPAP